MPGVRYFKTFEYDGIAAGDTRTGTWTAEENLTIRRVYIVEKAGTALRKSTFYLKISDRVYTREVMPCSVLGENVQVTPEVNIPFKKAETLSFTLKNNETAAISVWIVFEVE
jgi:hypothetical protein